MAFHAWTLSPPLSHFVETLWVQDESGRAESRERVLPAGAMGLIINLSDERGPAAAGWDAGGAPGAATSVLCGVHSESFVLEWPAGSISLVGAAFRPGGAFPFLPFPAGELHGMHVPVEAVWGRAGRELRDRLRAAPSAQAKARTLGSWLLQRAVLPLERPPLIAFALAEFERGGGSVGDVTARIGLSPRRFIEVFRDSVGLTPKLFCRVRRFQDALAAIGRGGGMDLVDLALAAGYYDQSHFNHDFRAFSGLTPSAYAARRGEYQNHVRIEGSDRPRRNAKGRGPEG